MMKKVRIDKKIFILIPTILVILIISFFCVPIKYGRSLYQEIQYRKIVNAVLSPENFDKLKVSSVTLTKTTTGTTPFNTDTRESVDDGSVLSNMNGIDVSDKDNYVRTKDKFRYDIELSIAKNYDNPEVQAGQDYYGGVVKIKVTIPTDENGTQYYRFVSQAWSSECRPTSTVCYINYKLPSDKLSNGAVQGFYFEFFTEGYSQELDESMLPIIEFWMEGNKNDNPLSNVDSKFLSYGDNNKLFITGIESYELQLTQGEVNYPSILNGKKGNYVNFGLQYAMKQPFDYISDFRGVSLPFGDISSKITFKYKYRNQSSSNWIEITDETPMGTQYLDEVQLIAAGLADEPTENFMPGEKYNKLSSWRKGIYCGGINNYDVCYNGGNVASSMNNRIISTTNDNWTVRGDLNGTEGTFIYDGLELFIPYYDNENSNDYSYQIVLSGISLTYNNYKNETKTIDSNRTYTITLQKTFNSQMRSSFYGIVSDKDITMISSGTKQTFYANLSPFGGAYMGGISELYTWNSTYLGFPNDGNKNYYYYNSTGSNNVVIKYGIYNPSPLEGINDDDIVNSATFEDFTWYEDVQEARSNGEIAAIYYWDPYAYGFEQSINFNISLEAKPDADNIGKITIVKRKIKACIDEERTNCILKGFNETYTPAPYENGSFSSLNGDPIDLGETVIIGGYSTSINLNTYDVNDSNQLLKTTFNIWEDYVGIRVIPSISSVVDEGDRETWIKVRVYIPKYLSYVENSSNIEPYNIYQSENEDTIIEYYFENWKTSEQLPIITLTASLSQELANNSIKAILCDIRSEDNPDLETRISFNNVLYYLSNPYRFQTISIVSLSGQSSRKRTSNDYIDTNSSFKVDNFVYNISSKNLSNLKTIEVLPKNNDSGGSIFSGSYTTKIDSLQDGQRMYYSTLPISQLDISEDDNQMLVVGNIDSNWTEVHVGETIPANATVIASTLDDLPSNGVLEFSYIFNTTDNKAGDKYVFKMYTSSENLINSISTGNKIITVNNKMIKGKVFEDTDRNNSYSQGDKLLNNITIRLLDENLDEVATTQTNKNGEYTFEGLGSENYYVDFGTTPNKYSIIANSEDSVVNQNGKSNLITAFSTDEDLQEIIVNNINAGYILKPSVITIHHYIEGTTTRLVPDETINKYYTDSYSSNPIDTTKLNYEYANVSGDDQNGIINQDTYEIVYYYKLKKGKVITHHYLYNGTETTTKLAPDVENIYNYTETYNTTISTSIASNYEFYKKTNNYTGTVNAPVIEVFYYYQLKDSTLSANIEITGTDEIDNKNDIVDYHIKYNASIIDYIGNATVVITDTLPYEIDVDNSNLNGGVYNSTNKTITWTENISDINSYTENNNTKNIIIEKDISIKYTGIVGRDRIMVNSVKGNITLSNNNRETTNSKATNIRIKGIIVIKYLDNQGNIILPTEESSDLVGESLIIASKEKEGYKLIELPETEELEFEDEPQEFKYIYERLSFQIITNAKDGGTITGDEKVFYGDDSTPGSIVIKANDGYVIESVTINGNQIDIEPNQQRLVLDQIHEVKENQIVEVTFIPVYINPNTGTISPVLLLIVMIITGFVICLLYLKMKKYNFLKRTR